MARQNKSEPLSITNENFSFNSVKSKKEKQEAELQSPDESHFALTPVANSQCSSPANGFTSKECSELLQQELDELEQKELSKEAKDEAVPSVVSIDGLMSPTEENISMFSRNEAEESIVEEKEDKVEDENYGEVSVVYGLDVCQ